MIQVDLARNLEHGSMIPVDLDGKIEAWIYDPNGSDEKWDSDPCDPDPLCCTLPNVVPIDFRK